MDDLKTYFAAYGKMVMLGVVSILFSVTFLILAQFLSELKSFKYIGQEIEFRHTISVSGKGEVAVIPDVAEVSFAVIHEGKEVSEAQVKVTNAMNEILAYLKTIGVLDKDVKTTSYNISPRYEYRAPKDFPRGAVESYPPYPYPQNQELVGYEVSHWVTVKVRAIDKAGEVIGKIGTLGATNVSNISLTVDDQDVVEREARKKAINDAEEKAYALARDLGVRLVKVVSFSDGGTPVYYKRDFAVMEGYGGASLPPAPEIPVGENTITSYVTITYAID